MGGGSKGGYGSNVGIRGYSGGRGESKCGSGGKDRRGGGKGERSKHLNTISEEAKQQ